MIDAAALSRKEFDELILVIFDIYLENVTFAMPMRAYGRVVGRAFSVVCLCLCKWVTISGQVCSSGHEQITITYGIQ